VYPFPAFPAAGGLISYGPSLKDGYRQRPNTTRADTSGTNTAGANATGTNTGGADATGTNTGGAETTTAGDHPGGIEERPGGKRTTKACRPDCQVIPVAIIIMTGAMAGATSSRPLTHYPDGPLTHCLERPLTQYLKLWTAFSGNGRLKQPSDQNTYISGRSPRGGLSFCIRTISRMSASGPKQTFHFALPKSVLGGKADVAFCSANVCF
jgi:hypothetical protein